MNARAALVSGARIVIKLTPIIGKNPFKKITSAVVGAGMDVAAKLVQRDFENEVRSWKTQPVFYIEKDSDNTRTVVTDDEIFLYQDLGTKPHVIRPKRKRALAWPGGKHPVKVVHHPGTKAQNFTKRVQAKAPSRLLEALNEVMRKAAN